MISRLFDLFKKKEPETKKIEQVALIADIHANFPALQAVLAEIERRGVANIWLLGDALGRGSFAPEVYEWTSRTFSNGSGNQVIRGNHDDWVLNSDGDGWKQTANPIFIASDTLEREELSQKEPGFPGIFREIQKEIEMGVLGEFEIHLVHESPDGRKDYLYPWRISAYEEVFAWMKQNHPGGKSKIVCLGHTHVPVLIHQKKDGSTLSEKLIPFKKYDVDPESNWIMNPGSTGYPLDGNSRASFAILNLVEKSFEWIKVEYDLQESLDCLYNKDYPPEICDHIRQASLPGSAPNDWFEHFRDVYKGLD